MGDWRDGMWREEYVLYSNGVGACGERIHCMARNGQAVPLGLMFCGVAYWLSDWVNRRTFNRTNSSGVDLPSGEWTNGICDSFLSSSRNRTASDARATTSHNPGLCVVGAISVF